MSTCSHRAYPSQTVRVTVLHHNKSQAVLTCHLAIPLVFMASIHHWSQNLVMVWLLCPCIQTHHTFCHQFLMFNLKCMQLRRVIIMGIQLRGFIQLLFLLPWHTIILNMSPGQMVKVPYLSNTLSTQGLDKMRCNMPVGVPEMRSRIGFQAKQIRKSGQYNRPIYSFFS